MTMNELFSTETLDFFNNVLRGLALLQQRLRDGVQSFAESPEGKAFLEFVNDRDALDRMSKAFAYVAEPPVIYVPSTHLDDEDGDWVVPHRRAGFTLPGIHDKE